MKGVFNHRQPVSNSVQYVDQAKLLRVMHIIQFMRSPKTVEDIAEHFNVHTRTIRRYILLISNSGFQVDKMVVGYNKVFFSIKQEGKCPLCGREESHG